VFTPPSTPAREAAFRQSLEAIPVRNAAVKVRQTPNPDELEVEVALKYESLGLRIMRSLFKPASTKRYLLDKTGKLVYESIDGKKNFGQLIDDFAAAQKLTFFESRALLGQYMMTLSKRGLIGATFPNATGD